MTFNSKESYFLYHSKPNALNCTRSLLQFGKHFVIFPELDLCGSLESVFIPVWRKLVYSSCNFDMTLKYSLERAPFGNLCSPNGHSLWFSR